MPKDVIRPLNIDCSVFVIDKSYREYFFIVGIQIDSESKEITEILPFYKGFISILEIENYFDSGTRKSLLGKKVNSIADLNGLHDSVNRLLRASNFYRNNPNAYELFSYYPSQDLSRNDVISLLGEDNITDE